MSITLEQETIANKNRALELIKSLQNFIKSQQNNSETSNVRIRSINENEMITMILIPWNDNKGWNNKVSEYYSECKVDARYFLKLGYYSDRFPNYISVNKFNIVRMVGNRGTGTVIKPEYMTNKYGNNPAPIYQDNANDYQQFRTHHDYYGYRYDGQGDTSSPSWYPQGKTATWPGFIGFFPVFEV